ncbi:two-component response regulator-like APRR1 [Apium graveolens]|uniref:two-component response regulator-like APRR1 n=1 Tax=Apium graveolens TaxID=4045 RepID=UPI003D7B99DD
MERSDMVLSKGGGGGGNTGKGGEGFIDRSKVRILLCDSDPKRLDEAFTLLCKCSYQVTSVRSPRQVIGALNAEGPDIDIILSEVDLPMAKGLKLLKYITRDTNLRRIPVIMMSAQDEVSVVVKCLRLGAADYLVKPLRTNELLNLWTHMWRRRRMLGLPEKNIVNYDFDPVASDPSDANTNSTTLFSDDTDDRSRKNPEPCLSAYQEDNNTIATIAALEATPPTDLSAAYFPDPPVVSHQQRGPKKSELRIGESSAFFAYVKSGLLKSNSQVVIPADENPIEQLRIEKKFSTWSGQMFNDTQGVVDKETHNNNIQIDDLPRSKSIPVSFSTDTPSPYQADTSQQRNSKLGECSQMQMHVPHGSHHDMSRFGHYPYYVPGHMNQVMMSTPTMYQKDLQDPQNTAPSTLLHQSNHVPYCPPHMPGVAPFPYYPVNVCLQPGQMLAPHPWMNYGGSSTDGKPGKVDRREAALLKFRQKRKQRCFDKKIRYVNRKKLAEKRPRVRGQFVRKLNGLNVDLNGHPTSTDFDDDEDDEDEDED